jgi:hypothetical protein
MWTPASTSNRRKSRMPVAAVQRKAPLPRSNPGLTRVTIAFGTPSSVPSDTMPLACVRRMGLWPPPAVAACPAIVAPSAATAKALQGSPAKMAIRLEDVPIEESVLEAEEIGDELAAR